MLREVFIFKSKMVLASQSSLDTGPRGLWELELEELEELEEELEELEEEQEELELEELELAACTAAASLLRLLDLGRGHLLTNDRKAQRKSASDKPENERLLSIPRKACLLAISTQRDDMVVVKCRFEQCLFKDVCSGRKRDTTVDSGVFPTGEVRTGLARTSVLHCSAEKAWAGVYAQSRASIQHSGSMPWISE